MVRRCTYVVHDDVESAHPVGSNKQQLVFVLLTRQRVDVPYLALGQKLQFGQVGTGDAAGGSTARGNLDSLLRALGELGSSDVLNRRNGRGSAFVDSLCSDFGSLLLLLGSSESRTLFLGGGLGPDILFLLHSMSVVSRERGHLLTYRLLGLLRSGCNRRTGISHPLDLLPLLVFVE